MPSTSQAQQHLMGLAYAHPEKVSAKNKSVLSMSKDQLKDFAATPTKKLPRYKSVPKK